MTTPTPDLDTIQKRMESDINHYIPGAELRPKFSVLTVIIKVYAAAIHSLYQYSWGLLRNILPSTCQESWLSAWAHVLNVPRIEATQAQGMGEFYGTGDIPAGTELQDPQGNLFKTIAATGTGEAVQFIASTAGTSSNSNASTLALKHPISGVDNNFVITSPPANGTEQEPAEQWRERLVEKFADRQKIGDADDYTELVKSIDSSIRYVWIYGNTPGLGQITIICALAGSNPIPSNEKLSNIKEKLSISKNVGAEIIIEAPSATQVPVAISGVNEASKIAINDSLIALFNSQRKQGATLYVADIHAAIRQVYGGIYRLNQPASDITADAKTLLTMNEISWE